MSGSPRDVSAVPRVGVPHAEAPFPDTVRALLARVGICDPVSIARALLTTLQKIGKDARMGCVDPAVTGAVAGNVFKGSVNPVQDALPVLGCLGIPGLGGRLLAAIGGHEQNAVMFAQLGANLA